MLERLSFGNDVLHECLVFCETGEGSEQPGIVDLSLDEVEQLVLLLLTGPSAAGQLELADFLKYDQLLNWSHFTTTVWFMYETYSLQPLGTFIAVPREMSTVTHECMNSLIT